MLVCILTVKLMRIYSTLPVMIPIWVNFQSLLLFWKQGIFSVSPTAQNQHTDCVKTRRMKTSEWPTTGWRGEKTSLWARRRFSPVFNDLKQRRGAACRSLRRLGEERKRSCIVSGKAKHPAGKWKSVSVMLSCSVTVIPSDCHQIFDATPPLLFVSFFIHQLFYYLTLSATEIFEQSCVVWGGCSSQSQLIKRLHSGTNNEPQLHMWTIQSSQSANTVS